MPAGELRSGQLLGATVDSPWVHNVDRNAFLATFQPLRDMAPDTILSTHLPPAMDRASEFMERLAAAPGADPLIGPDQHALEEMLATFEPNAA